MKRLKGRTVVHPLIGFLTLPTSVVGEPFEKIEKTKCWGAVASALAVAVFLAVSILKDLRGMPANAKLISFMVFLVFFAQYYILEKLRDYELKPFYYLLIGLVGLSIFSVAVFFFVKMGYSVFVLGNTALAGMLGPHIYLVLTGKHYRVNGMCVILDEEVENGQDKN